MPHLEKTVYANEDFISYDMRELSHSSNLINSIVVPRPIALVTSTGFNGVVNVAPFSYFNIVCTEPHIVLPVQWHPFGLIQSPGIEVIIKGGSIDLIQPL